MHYGYTKKTSLPFLAAIERTKEELAREGFGVLSEINVKETMKKKLGVDLDNYIILGACNPQNAYQALQAEKEIGLLLPCNVIVYENADGVFVSAIVPTVALGIAHNEALDLLARDVEDKLKRAVDATATAS